MASSARVSCIVALASLGLGLGDLGLFLWSLTLPRRVAVLVAQALLLFALTLLVGVGSVAAFGHEGIMVVRCAWHPRYHRWPKWVPFVTGFTLGPWGFTDGMCRPCSARMLGELRDRCA